MSGWIKIHRKMTKWGWYTDEKTKAVFLHLLLSATHEECEYMGYKLQPGQCVAGIRALSSHLDISFQSIRTALQRLKSTHEITIKTTSKFSIISITNWSEYQCTNKLANKQLTRNQHATNTIQEGKEGKEVKKGSSRRAGPTPPIKESDPGERPTALLVEEVNSRLGGFKKIRAMSEARRKKYLALKKRVDVDEYFAVANRQPFLLGENDRGWVASFDWLIKPSNVEKVLEEAYVNSVDEGRKEAMEELVAMAKEHAKEEEEINRAYCLSRGIPCE